MGIVGSLFDPADLLAAVPGYYPEEQQCTAELRCTAVFRTTVGLCTSVYLDLPLDSTLALPQHSTGCHSSGIFGKHFLGDP